MALRIDPVFKLIAGFYAASFAAKKADQYLDSKIEKLRSSDRTQSEEEAAVVVSSALTDMRQYINTSSVFARWLMQEFIITVEANDRHKFHSLVNLYASSISGESRQTLWNTAIISGRELRTSSSLADCQHALVLHDFCAQLY